MEAPQYPQGVRPLTPQEAADIWMRAFSQTVQEEARLYATAYQALEIAMGTAPTDVLANQLVPALVASGSAAASQALQRQDARLQQLRDAQELERLRQQRLQSEQGGQQPW